MNTPALCPKTQQRIDRLAGAVRKQYQELAGKDIGMMRAVAEQILREQDRDTRHACAEAVISLADSETNVSARAITTAICQRAHQACMNAFAI